MIHTCQSILLIPRRLTKIKGIQDLNPGKLTLWVGKNEDHENINGVYAFKAVQCM